MVHNLKIRKEFADAIIAGDKTFEIRENERGYQKGDRIRFTVIAVTGVTTDRIEHELNTKEYEITYVLNGWGLKNGYVVFGIKELINKEN